MHGARSHNKALDTLAAMAPGLPNIIPSAPGYRSPVHTETARYVTA
jgi:hypothetical protein